MKHLLLLFFISSLHLQSNASEKIKVFILVGDNNQKNEDFDNISKYIYFDKDYKVDDFEIIHLTKSNKITRSISSKKKIVTYKSNLLECSERMCDKLNGIVDLNKTEITKFFFCEENPFNCNFTKYGVETMLLNDKQYFTISDKINEEIKKNKKELTLFFFIPSKRVLDSESITFDSDSLKVEEGTTIKLKPKYSKGIVNFEWKPSTNLDCSSCDFPNLTAKTSSSYQVKGKDSLGCEVISKPIKISVQNNCKLGHGCVNFDFDQISSPKYHFVNENGDENYDWQIKSNSSGGYQFDVITTSNCATRYRVIIEDLQGNSIWEKEYLKEDVDKRSKNNYHEEYPDHNVYRLSLNKIESFINKNTCRLKIISYDEKGNHYEVCKSKIRRRSEVWKGNLIPMRLG